MAQNTRIIDITQSFLPIDPQSLDDNLGQTQKEDYPKKTDPVIAFEGINFLPTGQGYKSYFGATPFDIPECPAGVTVDKVLIVENTSYKNFFVVLADTGVYTNGGTSAEAWVQVVTLDAPAPGTHKIWTTVVSGNALYMYRQADPSYAVLENTFDGVTPLTLVVPTFLNMAGQIGIYKAGGRLGFWDSDNSTAWSSIDDFQEFTPDLETLAGSVVFSEIRGKITMITPFGDGFIIYSTASIVAIYRDTAATFQWTPKVLMNGNGVAYPEQVCFSSPDTTQFAYTSIGLHKIEANGSIEVIATPVTDLLKESLNPITIKLLENRYLVLQLAESKFVEGTVLLYSRSYEYEGSISVVTDIPTIPDIQNYPFEDLFQIAYAYPNDTMAYLYGTGRNNDHQFLGATDVAAAILANPSLPEPIADAFYTPLWEYEIATRGPSVVEANGDIHFSTYKSAAQCEAGNYTQDINPPFGPSFAGNQLSYNAHITTERVPVEGADSLRSFLLAGVGAYKEAVAQNLLALEAYATNIDYYDPTGVAHAINSPGSIGTILLMYTKSFLLNEDMLGGPLEGAGWTVTAYFTDEGRDLMNTAGLTKLILVGWRYTGVDGSVNAISVVESNGAAVDWSGTLEYDTYESQILLQDTDTINPYPWTPDPLDTLPITIVLQDGSQGPIYPDYLGFLVYDLHLKKWGKCKATYTQLVDLSPINTNQGAIVTTQRVGINAGIYAAGIISRFNDSPEESYITYGKIGMYRKGGTMIEEVNIDFRTPSTGTIMVSTSLDGRNLEYNYEISGSFTSATWYNLGVSANGKWHCIQISGKYDITHLDYVGLTSGRR